MWTQVERLVADLRRRGADVSLTEVLDAARAIEYVDLTQRVDLRSMLGATLVKQAHHQAMFAELFDRHFPARLPPSRSQAPRTGPPMDADAPDALDSNRDALDREELLGATLDPDADPRLLVERIVER